MPLDQILTIAIGFVSLCFLVFTAAMGLLIRVLVKAVKGESKLDALADDLKELMDNKDRIHTEIVAQINRDRDATDRRLRYLEEWHMNYGDEKKRSNHAV